MIIKMISKLYLYLYSIYSFYFKYKVFLKKKSYAQSKEDVFIESQFPKNFKGFFVDVGCNHPVRINNTYLLYLKGWRGVNIDMDYKSIFLFNFLRDQDLNFNYAVSKEKKKINYFFNKKSDLSGSIIKSKKFRFNKKIQSYPLNYILSKTKYKNKKIDFLSIDAEDSDFEVLKSLNLSIYRPRFICVEIRGSNNNKKNLRKSKIYLFLIKKNIKWSFHKMKIIFLNTEPHLNVK